MIERELKAVAPDPAAVIARLTAAGARREFAGLMIDRRFDANGALAGRDEVLRVRRYRGVDGTMRAKLAWKGPVSVDDGYKLRAEHEIETPDGDEAERLVLALGYRPVYAIDRYVEYYRIGAAIVRVEWYPRMDPLVEVEGDAEAIEAAIAATGLTRAAFTADALAEFTLRFEGRTGVKAAVALAELDEGAVPSWQGR